MTLYLQKCTADITINVEKLNTFPQRPGTKQRCHLTLLLANAIRQEKEIKVV